MSNVSDLERTTQNRVVKLLDEKLGYRYLGNWEDREDNRNIETYLLRTWLTKQGYKGELLRRAVDSLQGLNHLATGQNLYIPNEEIYNALYYGIQIKTDDSDSHQTVRLIDWRNPENNDFAFAEEVTIIDNAEKRPDIVIYVNGIALGILELKRGIVDVAKGIRQNLGNQQNEFIRSFFTTMQLVMAGNDSQGLRYGTIETPEQYYLDWKEENPDYNPKADSKSLQYLPLSSCDQGDNLLDCALLRLLDKRRFLEVIYHFTVFDKGVKKLCRHNQYFGIKAAQERIRQRNGGIIWHTQGSGKSLTMVWLAKWIRETHDDSRVLIITDRTELDEQIQGVFLGVHEQIHRCTSGRDMVARLNKNEDNLMCSLVHKFGAGDEGSDQQTDEYLRELEKNIPSDFSAKGNLFVFVDECHRTQSGKLHAAMSKLLPHALFIGFTGTPLMKEDKAKRSIEIFGSYIHTYKFDQAVNDKITLDLRYEARDIEQYVGNNNRIDQWFDTKTKSLSEMQKTRLKKKWVNMKNMLSSTSRLQEIVKDIDFDMGNEPRLATGRGNAMLVCSSVYQACTLYELFEKTDLRNKCAIITSYMPAKSTLKEGDQNEAETEALYKYKVYRRMLAEFFEVDEEAAFKKISQFESDVKERFIKHPGQMKLLIVVDKLLTGFDAPSATYLYIDKSMQDHGLFQAVCRVNRLDDATKEYGYIVDYKDLFGSLQSAMTDYTGGALDGFEKQDIEGLLKDRIKEGKLRLEQAREIIKAHCEPVPRPKNTEDYLKYFVSADGLDEQQKLDNEKNRYAFYKMSNVLLRAYVEIKGDLAEIGYSAEMREKIDKEVKHFINASEAVKLNSADYKDVKDLEPEMRFLFDQYIKANDSEKIADFDEKGIVELLVDSGITELMSRLPKSISKSKKSVAETIENNVKRMIVDQNDVNPELYGKMSEMLEALIAKRKESVIDYKNHLQQLKELAEKAMNRGPSLEYPSVLLTDGMRNLYDNLVKDEALTLRVHQAIGKSKKADWIGVKLKEKRVRNALKKVEGIDVDKLDELMALIQKQDDYQ